MTENSTGLYPIGKVAEMTGVNAVTLRAWERRYGLIQPTRTDKGHRLYAPADVERINGILKIMDAGIPISRVREILDTTLPDGTVTLEATSDDWQSHRAAMLAAIIQFDSASLDSVYNEVLSLYPHDLMTRCLLLPLLEELGDRWASAQSGVAEEHFFATYLRNKLGARLHHRQSDNHGPRIIIACLPGEHHEIGMLLFALTASDYGFRPLVFGADMPIEELLRVEERTSSSAIIVSSSLDPDDNILEVELPRLVKASRIPVFMGGRTSLRLQQRLEAIGVTTLGNESIEGIKLLQRKLRNKH